jgi:predicted negative regulator of RcsB-dependent stress response
MKRGIMAEKQQKSGVPGQPGVGEESNVPTEVQQFLRHVMENPLLYAAAAVIVVLAILVAVFYRMYSAAEDRAVMSTYFEALQEEEPADRLVALEPLAQGSSRWTDEALYMYAETAVRDEKFDVARDSYNRLLEQFPNSEYAASAAEGLAFLEERAGNYDAALQAYADVAANYAGTFTARLQPFNRGEVLELMERWEDAVAAYEEQVSAFPDSQIAMQSERAITRIKDAHPDLFPEVEEEVVSIEEAAGAKEAPVEEAPAEEAPVEEAPAEEAPAEEAPAEEAPAEEAPAEEAPAEEAPAEEAPAEEAPAEEAPAEEAPAEEAPAEEAAAETPAQ